MNTAQFSNYPSFTRIKELAQDDFIINAQWHERVKSYYRNKGNQALTNRELETLSFAYLQELLSDFIDDKAIPCIEEVVNFVSHDRTDLSYNRPNHTSAYFYSFLALYAAVGAGFITMWTTDVTDKVYDAAAENHLLQSRLAEIKENAKK
jgi:hypothetical protein